MTKEEKLKKLDLLRNQASALKKDVDYYNALQVALKLVLNGSNAFPPHLRVRGEAPRTEHLPRHISYCLTIM